MERPCTLAVRWDSTVFYWRKIKLRRVARRAHRGVSCSSVNVASWLLLWRSPFLKAEVNLSGETQLSGLSDTPSYYKNTLFIVLDSKCSSCVWKEFKIVSKSIWAPQIRCCIIQIVLFLFFQVKTHLQFVVLDIKLIHFFIKKKQKTD